MVLHIETEQEDDGRWIAEVPELSGVLAYGETRDASVSGAVALALRVIAGRLDHGELSPAPLTVSFAAWFAQGAPLTRSF